MDRPTPHPPSRSWKSMISQGYTYISSMVASSFGLHNPSTDQPWLEDLGDAQLVRNRKRKREPTAIYSRLVPDVEGSQRNSNISFKNTLVSSPIPHFLSDTDSDVSTPTTLARHTTTTLDGNNAVPKHRIALQDVAPLDSVKIKFVDMASKTRAPQTNARQASISPHPMTKKAPTTTAPSPIESTLHHGLLKRRKVLPDPPPHGFALKHVNGQHKTAMDLIIHQIPQVKLRRTDTICGPDGQLKPNPFWKEIYNNGKRRSRPL